MESFFKAVFFTFIAIWALARPLDVTIEDLKRGFNMIKSIWLTK